MRLWHWLTGPRAGQSLPVDIYVSLVNSLYNDFRTLFIGSIAAAITALITAVKTGEPTLYGCSLLIVLVACGRALDVRAFTQRRNFVCTAEEAARWEMRYVAGAAAHVALLGIWCFLAFAKTSDPFVQLFSFSLTLAYMIGISGRNFASSLLVTSQIVCAGIPMTAALMLEGGPYYAIFAFVLAPFFATLKFISDRLRHVLLDAVIAGRNVSLLAARFDTALNNMPHGLCMFDADRRLVVSNRRLGELLNLSPAIANRKPSLRELLDDAIRGGTLSASTAERLAADVEGRLSRKYDGELLVGIETGRTLAVTFQPMDNGGSVALVEDITDRKVAEAKISHLARYDTLTGLANRAFFRDQMDEIVSELESGGPCGVHFIDLDEFKQVNDTLGHSCGDELLCAVADRLRAVAGPCDFVGRFGGDEFVLLQRPVTHPAECAQLAERIVDALGRPFEVAGHQIVIGASVGVAVAPRDGSEADRLLKNADMALFRAKADGRRVWRFFEPGMDVMVQARRNLQTDLRNALATNVFQVHYQPLYNLHTHKVTTCEALLRWPHPQRGMVSPAEFIPMAEDMGLIVEIGNFVLRKACRECATWPDDVRVSINMSPIQFRRGNVTAVLKEALAESGLAPNRLEIEITESIFLQDTDVTRIWLDEVRELGVRISLDDFGTGYSSLSYLHSFPLNKVKIDRSFLHGADSNPRSRILLNGVARLSAELGMSVVVEGVETEEQLALVAREKSVEEVQGFLIGAAMPDRQIRDLLLADLSHFGKVA